jgi:hypothetical protein
MALKRQVPIRSRTIIGTINTTAEVVTALGYNISCKEEKDITPNLCNISDF